MNFSGELVLLVVVFGVLLGGGHTLNTLFALLLFSLVMWVVSLTTSKFWFSLVFLMVYAGAVVMLFWFVLCWANNSLGAGGGAVGLTLLLGVVVGIGYKFYGVGGCVWGDVNADLPPPTLNFLLCLVCGCVFCLNWVLRVQKVNVRLGV